MEEEVEEVVEEEVEEKKENVEERRTARRSEKPRVLWIGKAWTSPSVLEITFRAVPFTLTRTQRKLPAL
jgi:hypothetical protein